MTTGLEGLAARARAEMALFAYPDRAWVTPRIAPDGTRAFDAVIVGGGQSGLGAALGLKRAHVRHVLVLDENPQGGEGPWVTYGRMITLRTLKFLTGPDFGVPALTFRAWWEAQFGPEAWAALVRIPRGAWMAYLNWLRATIDVPVRNETRVDRIALDRGLVRLTLAPGGATIWTRKLVLATGLIGAGGLRVPALIREGLPRDRWAHSAEMIDFAALAGKRVAVLGAGASAYDNAATALEAGATRVDLFMRRDALPTTTALRHVETVGFFRHYAEMTDADRWRFTRRMVATSVPPPQDTVERATAFAQFFQHFAAGWTDVAMDGDAIRITTARAAHAADFVIAATGFDIDLARRPELADLLPHIALWRDRYAPPPEEADDELGRQAYTGPAYELLPRDGSAPPGLSDIHLYNHASLVSNGPTSGGLNGMPFGLPRLVHGLTGDLYRGETDRLYAGLTTYSAPDPWAAKSPSL